MVPAWPTVLNGLARTLMMDLAPHVDVPYAGQTFQLGAALLMMAAQEFDRAAARLAEENAALEALFTDAEGAVADAELRDALTRAAAAREASLLVSALQTRNAALRGLLIRLHAHLETLDTDAARSVEQRVWAELVESTRRRQLDLAIG